MPADPPRPERDEVVERLEAAVAAFDALPEVDKALHLSDQRRSFLRGQLGREPPADVLADEVRSLRARLAQAVRERDAAQAYTRSRDADIIALGDQVAQAERRAEEAERLAAESLEALRRYEHENDCLQRQVQQLDYPCSPHCQGYLREQQLRRRAAALAAALAADAQGGRGDG